MIQKTETAYRGKSKDIPRRVVWLLWADEALGDRLRGGCWVVKPFRVPSSRARRWDCLIEDEVLNGSSTRGWYAIDHPHRHPNVRVRTVDRSRPTRIARQPRGVEGGKLHHHRLRSSERVTRVGLRQVVGEGHREPVVGGGLGTVLRRIVGVEVQPDQTGREHHRGLPSGRIRLGADVDGVVLRPVEGTRPRPVVRVGGQVPLVVVVVVGGVVGKRLVVVRVATRRGRYRGAKHQNRKAVPHGSPP